MSEVTAPEQICPECKRPVPKTIRARSGIAIQKLQDRDNALKKLWEKLSVYYLKHHSWEGLDTQTFIDEGFDEKIIHQMRRDIAVQYPRSLNARALFEMGIISEEAFLELNSN